MASGSCLTSPVSLVRLVNHGLPCRRPVDQVWVVLALGPGRYAYVAGNIAGAPLQSSLRFALPEPQVHLPMRYSGFKINIARRDIAQPLVEADRVGLRRDRDFGIALLPGDGVERQHDLSPPAQPALRGEHGDASDVRR